MNKKYYFVCPICKKTLLKKSHTYHCEDCKTNYQIVEGIPVFLNPQMGKIKEVEAETYSHRADSFAEEDALKMGRPEFTRPMREKVNKSDLILELCGGSARHGLNLMKDGYRVVESDIAIGAVQKARQFAEKLGIANKSFFCVIDAENIPFPENTFSAIFLIASLHHLQDYNKALKEIHRCLKPNGILLIGYEPNNWQYILLQPIFKLFKWIIRKKSNHPISIADDITYGFSKRKLHAILKKARFEIIDIHPVDLFSKIYEQTIELYNRLFNKRKKVNQKAYQILNKIDQKVLKFPIFKKLPLNWDIIAKKLKIK